MVVLLVRFELRELVGGVLSLRQLGYLDWLSDIAMFYLGNISHQGGDNHSGCGSALAHLKQQWLIQQIWSNNDVIQQIWNNNDRIQQIWNNNDRIQQIWNNNDRIQQLWNNNDINQQIWNNNDIIDNQTTAMKCNISVNNFPTWHKFLLIKVCVLAHWVVFSTKSSD